MRLNKFLSIAGIASRRSADEIIKLGQVKINGKVVREMGVRIDVERDVVTINGRAVKPEPKVVTYLLNKRPGFGAERAPSFSLRKTG